MFLSTFWMSNFEDQHSCKCFNNAFISNLGNKINHKASIICIHMKQRSENDGNIEVERVFKGTFPEIHFIISPL